jgi:prefoldin subunit 5
MRRSHRRRSPRDFNERLQALSGQMERLQATMNVATLAVDDVPLVRRILDGLQREAQSLERLAPPQHRSMIHACVAELSLALVTFDREMNHATL